MTSRTEIYQFKVTLKDIDPPVWRRIQVPATYSFWDLHVAIQDAMGWLDYHLHEFLIMDQHGQEVRTGIPDEDWEDDVLPDWEQRIADYLSLERPQFQYVYDFGDGWEHEIELEGILPADPDVVYPRCIWGERSCPPEDCGGPHGYSELLEVLADPKHDEHASAKNWANSMKGGAFDPDAFDPATVVFSDPQQRYRQAFSGEETISSEEMILDLIDAFDYYDGRYNRYEMEQAVALREEITPHLIGILEQLAEDPERYAAEGHYANTYAAALLSHFQEPAAHLPIIKAFSLPDEMLDELWEDITTELLPVFLIQTCNGSLDAIRSLVLDKNINEYVRGSAIVALSYAVARGMAQREEVISFLVALFTGEEAERGGSFWNSIVWTIVDLHPEGAMDVIRKAYADGSIDDDYVTLEEIEDQLEREPEEVIEELREQVERKIPRDIHDYLSQFACFNERPVFPSADAKQEKKKKKGNKAKKKMAKKSKRKNRK